MRRGVVGSTKRREGRREIRIYISIIWDDSENGSRASFFPYPLRLRNFILFFLSRERNGGKLDVKIAIEGTCLYVDVNGEFSWALGNFEIERSANDRLLGFRFTRLPARLQTHGARSNVIQRREPWPERGKRYGMQRLDHRYRESCLNQVQPRLNIAVMSVRNKFLPRSTSLFPFFTVTRSNQ